MSEQSQQVTWLASYPKSGNTFLRILLEAYERNGFIDINDIRICTSDGAAAFVRGLSPTPLDLMGFRGEALLRPAALINLFCRHQTPVMCKTHWANIQPKGLPPGIPPDLTHNAVYVVRDPRDVITSFAKFFNFPIELAVTAMANKDFVIGGTRGAARSMVSSWSNHVASWTAETEFPVHIIKYEDMCADPGKELVETLEFLGKEVDHDRVKKAVEAADLSRIKKAEQESGFAEDQSGNGFFTAGGSRWQDELGPKWIQQIQSDHGEVMRLLGYLDKQPLRVVKDEEMAG